MKRIVNLYMISRRGVIADLNKLQTDNSHFLKVDNFVGAVALLVPDGTDAHNGGRESATGM